MDSIRTGPAEFEEQGVEVQPSVEHAHEEAPDAQLNIDALVGGIVIQNALLNLRVEALLKKNEQLTADNGELAEALLEARAK